MQFDSFAAQFRAVMLDLKSSAAFEHHSPQGANDRLSLATLPASITRIGVSKLAWCNSRALEMDFSLNLIPEMTEPV
jgi:hypothetical protein